MVRSRRMEKRTDRSLDRLGGITGGLLFAFEQVGKKILTLLIGKGLAGRPSFWVLNSMLGGGAIGTVVGCAPMLISRQYDHDLTVIGLGAVIGVVIAAALALIAGAIRNIG